jgi:hypothetical protein
MSPDEFLSVACCAGFDSTDVTWMDAFEAICLEYGCDPAVGVSKEAFLKLVDEGLDRRRSGDSESRSNLLACSSSSTSSKVATWQLARKDRYPADFQRYLADYQELACELGADTMSQLGIDESGYRWAYQVFQQLGIHLHERHHLKSLDSIENRFLCSSYLPKSISSAHVLWQSQPSHAIPSLGVRPFTSLPALKDDVSVVCREEASGKESDVDNVESIYGARWIESQPGVDGEIAEDCREMRPDRGHEHAQESTSSSSDASESEDPMEGWNLSLYSSHWDG